VSARPGVGELRIVVWPRDPTPYQELLYASLRARGFTVLVFQPLQVKAYARLHLRRAKNDRLDAMLAAFGFPVVTVPGGASQASRLPVGIQLVSQRYDDDRLLARLSVAVVAAALAIAGCSSGGKGGQTSAAPTTTTATRCVTRFTSAAEEAMAGCGCAKTSTRRR